ncbi:MAG: thioredoxin domain-containing protein [Candidatus Omnitrophica bacterium]|nr:thioredoxin domain-containing protein [Candidatus Omnitrophota bacterium]
MIKLVEINDTQFNTLVLKASLPVLLECASPECIICKTMAERIKEAARDYSDQMLFFRLNINENKRWQEYSVRVIPTLLYFKEGRLIGRQENFPETEEILEQIRLVAGQGSGTACLEAECRNAIDLESAVALFYKYVSATARNGRVKERFRQLHHQAVAHEEILEKKYKELTKEFYRPTDEMVKDRLKPHGFSLVGAMKMAGRLEEKLLVFYKKLAKRKMRASERDIFRKIAAETSRHLKVLQKEKSFTQDRELESSMEIPEQSSWLNKVFE